MSDSDSEKGEPMKVVVVGDGAIGKTCLLICFTRNEFPTEYVPTVFEDMVKSITIMNNGNEHTVALHMCDTAGQEEFDRIRPLSYRDTYVFLVCFSVVSPDSFENISSKWIGEITHHQKNEEYQILLVGLKSDLKNNQETLKLLDEIGQKPVELSEIEECKKQINAIGYVECSSLTRYNVPNVFETAIIAFLNLPPEKPQSKCVSAQNICIFYNC